MSWEPRNREPKRSRDQEPIQEPHVSLPGRVLIVRHRKRASPPTVIASERKMMPEKRMHVRKTSRSRSPTPTTSLLPEEPKIVDNMSGCVRARLKWCPRS